MKVRKTVAEPEIFKVQLSIYTGLPTRQVLIYNKDRSVEGQLNATQDIVDLMGGELKRYIYGTIRKNGVIDFGKFAPDQEW